MATRLRDAEHALAQAESAVGTLHATIEVLAEAEDAVARVRRRLPRLRTLVVIALGVGLTVVLLELAARRRAARAHIPAFDDIDLTAADDEESETSDGVDADRTDHRGVGDLER